MIVKIEIECEDWRELGIHLSVIRSQLKKRIAKYEDTPESNVLPQDFDDNNCYGSHKVHLDFG